MTDEKECITSAWTRSAGKNTRAQVRPGVMDKKIIIASIFIIFLVQDAIATSIAYDQYTVKEVFAGKPATPNLSTHKEASRYRTVLRNQSKRGPNFAGHYTIVTIGCGTSCAGIAVIDAQTGYVYFP